ncbi:peptidoglycan-binding protein [Pseudochrobactrum sp. sp1633]|uniref:peptidoglycan-binding protein n=1 Tax=Pseudochrobactrum sp. sp1633 TaxID=3036706 RepID=UPI0025A59FCD|nr:peptidoglycan-binding protein [Pseudochrobactrum sp. sp1633]MDM8346554.1 peptidoglycan-binding protein [Pseudochrobactrum sp. sp1633]HWD12674.1 peptidoglycan-binding protein [Pseudochrobactrum sp.]
MTNQRSPLDNLNMRRERRPLASLDELNRTLSALENHLLDKQNPDSFTAPQSAADEIAETDALEFLRHEQAAQHRAPQTPAAADNPHKEALAAIADELQRLRARTELRQAAAITEKLHTTDANTHNAVRVSAAERFIAGTSSYTSIPSHTADTDGVMRRDFEELKRTVETLAREESLRRMSHRWDALDERFDNFEQKQSEKLHSSQSVSIDPALDAISARLEELRNAVEHLPDNQGNALRQLDERLDEISRAILATSYQRQQPEQERAVFEELDRRFADLTNHLDEQYHSSTQKNALNDDRFIQALENRLDHITRQVTEQTAAIQAVPAAAPLADQQLLRNLEKQLGFITEHLSKPESLMPELAEIKPRLDVIERAIDINRDTVLSAAREAAEEAIRQVVDKGSARDTGFARQLADDLKALEQLTRDTDERNNRTFNKVHDTLLKIADRLGQIEKDNLQKPPHAQAARSAGQREQDNANRFTSQFSIPEWGNDTEQPSGSAFAELRGNTSRATPFAPVPSPAAAAIEAARAAVKSAANPAGDRAGDRVSAVADTESTKETPRKSLLGGLAQAVRRTKPTEQAPADTTGAFQIEDNDLLTLDTVQEMHIPQIKAEEERTDQTLAAMPDLNAIIRRVRDEQRDRGTEQVSGSGKSDLISAARRAVQAAADETGRLRDQNLSDGNLNGDITGDEDRLSGTDKPKRSLRKPLLLAIGAVIIAVTGMQLGNSYMAANADRTAPQSPDLASIQPAPASTEPLIIEDKKPVLPTITTLDTKTDMADQNGSALQITSLNHAPLSDMPEAQPLGSRPFPTQPLSATPMAGSTQAIIKPVVITPPVTSTLDMQPMPAPADSNELAAYVAPERMPAATAMPDQSTTQSLPQSVETSAPVQLSTVPAVAKEAGPIALRNAAEGGDARALYEIGMRYTDGRGVASDFAEAAKWYALSAERGFAPAQYRLGNFNEKGLGMPRDAAKATKLYEQAAAQGNASAMHNLAVLYAMGTGGSAGGEADNNNAAKWFFKAAELGVKDSQYNLGILTAKGLGRTQNLEESYKWFALAAEAGDTDAAEKRDQVAKSLKPEQLERAINLTKLWKPKDMIEEANSASIPDAWSDDKAVTTASVDMKKAVRNIQLILQKNGYDAGTPDGVMGNKTRQAISAFQKANGMKPTGEVDQPLVEALLSKNS